MRSKRKQQSRSLVSSVDADWVADHHVASTLIYVYYNLCIFYHSHMMFSTSVMTAVQR